MMRSAVSRLDSSVYLAARLAISAVLSSSLARSITRRSSRIIRTAFIRNEHGIVPLRPQGANRENVDVMGGVVATEGRRRSDNGAKLGLRVVGRRVGGDLFAQALDISDAVGHLGLAELDFQRRPAAVAKLDCVESEEQPLQALVDKRRRYAWAFRLHMRP